ncbi:MAG: hypothetical protein LBB12_03050 [Holosporaceae bacterium]|jgi:hypothetical protein|nr:hypothetical protein [Holosporaceae bacterium]
MSIKKCDFLVLVASLLLSFPSLAEISREAYLGIGKCFSAKNAYLNPMYGYVKEDIILNQRKLCSKDYAQNNCSIKNEGITPMDELCILLFPSPSGFISVNTKSSNCICRFEQNKTMGAGKITKRSITKAEVVALLLQCATWARNSYNENIKKILDLCSLWKSSEISDEDFRSIMALSEKEAVPSKLANKKAKINKKIKDMLDIGDDEIQISNDNFRTILLYIDLVIKCARQEMKDTISDSPVKPLYPTYYTEFLIHCFIRYAFSDAELRELLHLMKRRNLIDCPDSEIDAVGNARTDSAALMEKMILSIPEAFDLQTLNSKLNIPYYDTPSIASSRSKNAHGISYANCMEAVVLHLLNMFFYNRKIEQLDPTRLPKNTNPKLQEFFKKYSANKIANSEPIINNEFGIILHSLPIKEEDEDSSMATGVQNLLDAICGFFGLEKEIVASEETCISSILKVFNTILQNTETEITVDGDAFVKRTEKIKDYLLKVKFNVSDKLTKENLYSFSLQIDEHHGQILNVKNENCNGNIIPQLKPKIKVESFLDYFVMKDFFDNSQLYNLGYPLLTFLDIVRPDVKLDINPFLGNLLRALQGIHHQVSWIVAKNYLTAIKNMIDIYDIKIDSATIRLIHRDDVANILDQLIVLFAGLNEDDLHDFITHKIIKLNKQNSFIESVTNNDLLNEEERMKIISVVSRSSSK